VTASAGWSWTALRYTARSLPLVAIAAILLATTIPTIWTLESGLGLPLVSISFVWVTSAFAVDDDAGELTAASVIPLWRRRAMRLTVIATAGAIVWCALLAAIAVDETIANRAIPLREAITVGALSLGLAGVVHHIDQRSAALSGAFGAALVVLAITALAFRWQWLPSLGLVHHHARWWIPAAVGAAAAVFTSRDPAARHLLVPVRTRSASGRD
jgi:hypothetical protein